MTTEKTRQSHKARLEVWNRLFHGWPVSLEELDPETLCSDRDSPDERAAYVALRACTVLGHSARTAVRVAFRVVILFWFSNLGERRPGAKESLPPMSSAFHLGEAIGTGLTWEEAVGFMGRKPVDFSAYLWLLDALHVEYATQWQAAFPGTELAPIGALARPLSESAYAREWVEGLEPREPRGGRRAKRQEP